MSLPYRLKLCRSGLGLKLFALPVSEIESLRETPHTWSDAQLKAGENPLAALSGDLWDIDAEIAPGSATEFGFSVRGRKVVYRVKEKQLLNGEAVAGMNQEDGRIRIRILVDRTSVEVFGNDGEVVMPCCFLPDEAAPSLEMFARGGTAQIVSMRIFKMQSIWRHSPA